jgi:hypothetical protein
VTELPARVMPVPAEIGSVERHHHQVPHARFDVLVASGTQVLLGGLKRMNDADLDLVAVRQRGISAHNSASATMMNAAATKT